MRQTSKFNVHVTILICMSTSEIIYFFPLQFFSNWHFWVYDTVTACSLGQIHSFYNLYYFIGDDCILINFVLPYLIAFWIIHPHLIFKNLKFLCLGCGRVILAETLNSYAGPGSKRSWLWQFTCHKSIRTGHERTTRRSKSFWEERCRMTEDETSDVTNLKMLIEGRHADTRVLKRTQSVSQNKEPGFRSCLTAKR